MTTISQFEQVRKQELNYTCSACGADRGCDCNAPAIKKAAAAIAASPQKSDRAIAAETGVSHTTVQNARKQVANDLPPEPADADDSAPESVRIGRDGKSYPAEKKKREAVPADDPGKQNGGGAAGNREIENAAVPEAEPKRKSTLRRSPSETIEHYVDQFTMVVRNLVEALGADDGHALLDRIDAEVRVIRDETIQAEVDATRTDPPEVEAAPHAGDADTRPGANGGAAHEDRWINSETLP
jgi:hypothetical protein